MYIRIDMHAEPIDEGEGFLRVRVGDQVNYVWYTSIALRANQCTQIDRYTYIHIDT